MTKENLAELRDLRVELRTYYPEGKKSADEGLIHRRLALRILEVLDALEEAPLILVSRKDLYALLEENRLLRNQVENTLANNTKLVEQRRRLKKLLKRLEFPGDDGYRICAFCVHAMAKGHKPDCEYVAAMECT